MSDEKRTEGHKSRVPFSSEFAKHERKGKTQREKNRWIFKKRKKKNCKKCLTEKEQKATNQLCLRVSFLKSLANQRKCVWEQPFIVHL